jgi:hypothetical protein
VTNALLVIGGCYRVRVALRHALVNHHVEADLIPDLLACFLRRDGSMSSPELSSTTYLPPRFQKLTVAELTPYFSDAALRVSPLSRPSNSLKSLKRPNPTPRNR